jgi:hypothetical protein
MTVDDNMDLGPDEGTVDSSASLPGNCVGHHRSSD